MPSIHGENPLDPEQGKETPEAVFFARRKWLQAAGLLTGTGLLAAGGLALWRRFRQPDEEVLRRGEPSPAALSNLSDFFPAVRDPRFEYGRRETVAAEAARYTNFYEFSRYKSSWRYVDSFQPYPWKLVVDGLCRNPLTLDMDDLHRRYADDLVERHYRHRCVERWAMAVPWTGIPLARLLKDADPLPSATHVRFVSFFRPEEAPNQAGDSNYPWPFVEGLTIHEAMVDLTLLATGIYGRPLLKQHGAPVRLVVPWKYGYKSIKSIERIELVDGEPNTFWTTLNGKAYPFQANVDPQERYPWNQSYEHMLGTDERLPTQPHNGYARYVAHLYAS